MNKIELQNLDKILQENDICFMGIIWKQSDFRIINNSKNAGQSAFALVLLDKLSKHVISSIQNSVDEKLQKYDYIS